MPRWRLSAEPDVEERSFNVFVYKMLVCYLRFVWCVALFYSRVALVNCHCKNASTHLWGNGCIIMNLKGNTNYFKDLQMFRHRRSSRAFCMNCFWCDEISRGDS